MLSVSQMDRACALQPDFAREPLGFGPFSGIDVLNRHFNFIRSPKGKLIAGRITGSTPAAFRESAIIRKNMAELSELLF
jgi:hypothetical protein